MIKNHNIIKIIIIIIALYILFYLFRSRLGMMDNIVSNSNGDTIWGFYSMSLPQSELEKKPKDQWYDQEKPYRYIFYPLIKIDRYIFGNYHILENELPYVGG